jgi:hypothetical protein
MLTSELYTHLSDKTVSQKVKFLKKILKVNIIFFILNFDKIYHLITGGYTLKWLWNQTAGIFLDFLKIQQKNLD